MMLDPEDYDALALRSREGDPKALALLYRHLAPPLLEHLERMLAERSDAEDVLHEVFVRVFQGRGRYKGQGRFRSWLFTVATRLALDMLRQRQRRGQLATSVVRALERASAPDPCEEVLHRDLLKKVESVLSDLPPTYAMAFHLRVREGFSYREIASICGDREGTLRSRVHHTLKRIRLVLQKTGYQAPMKQERKEDPQ